MTDSQSTLDPELESWLMTERWFIRYIGGAAILIGIISFFVGTLDNPDSALFVSFINFAIAVVLIIVGLWTILSANNDERMHTMMNGFLDQPANRPLIFAVIQGIMGLLFLLDGFSGRIPMLLFGMLLLTSAGWFVRRSMQIRRFQ